MQRWCLRPGSNFRTILHWIGWKYHYTIIISLWAMCLYYNNELIIRSDTEVWGLLINHQIWAAHMSKSTLLLTGTCTMRNEGLSVQFLDISSLTVPYLHWKRLLIIILLMIAVREYRQSVRYFPVIWPVLCTMLFVFSVFRGRLIDRKWDNEGSKSTGHVSLQAEA